MNNRDCIGYLESNKNLFVRGSENCKGEALELHNQYISAMDYAIEAVKFAEFTGKMLFDDWENDCKDLYPELACRRLVELGIVELNDGVYSLKEDGE